MNDVLDDLKKNRINNSVQNVLSGISLNIVVTIGPFILRTLMLRFMGSQFLGLNSVMVSTVAMLNMAELGLGTVIIYFIYEPAAKGEIERVNTYLTEIKKLYLYVAAIILLCGMIMLFIIPQIAGTELVENTKVRYVYLLYLIATVTPYILWPEAGVILNAFQKRNLQDWASVITQMIMYCIQIYVICVIRSYYIYVLVVFVQGIALSFLQHEMAKKRFPLLRCEGRLDQQEKDMIKTKAISMIGHQLDEKLINNIDTLFVSILLGLTMVSIYSNYIYVVTALTMLTGVIYNAVLASVGNAIVVETIESNKIRFDCLFFLSSIIAGWSTLCMICMYQGFMKLWMPGLMLKDSVMILFCAFSYLLQIRKSIQTFKNAAGMWENDKFKPYVAMVADVVLNFLMIPKLGIAGALLSSIICVAFIEIPWEIHVLRSNYFRMEIGRFLDRFIKYNLINFFLIFVIWMLINRYFKYDGIVNLMVRFLVCTLASIVFYIGIYWKNRDFIIWKETLCMMVKIQ